MASNYGKKFEEKLKSNWESTVVDSWIFRLNDQMSGFKGSSRNPSDFIAFKSPDLFLIEAKSIKGNTFPVEFRQLEILKSEYAKNVSNLHVGVVVWFIEHDKIVYIPIQTFVKLSSDGKKSFNVKYLDTDDYDYLVIPSKKLRTFLNSDYSKLVDYCRGYHERD